VFKNKFSLISTQDVQ